MPHELGTDEYLKYLQGETPGELETTYTENVEKYIRESQKAYSNQKKNHFTITIQKLKEISRLEQFEELIMMGLRTSEGINLNNIEKKTDMSLNMDKLDYLKKSKFVSLKNKNLHLLTKGKLVLNKIVNELLT